MIEDNLSGKTAEKENHIPRQGFPVCIQEYIINKSESPKRKPAGRKPEDVVRK